MCKSSEFRHPCTEKPGFHVLTQKHRGPEFQTSNRIHTHFQIHNKKFPESRETESGNSYFASERIRYFRQWETSEFGNSCIDFADSGSLKSESGMSEIPDYFRVSGAAVVQHCTSPTATRIEKWCSRESAVSAVVVCCVYEQGGSSTSTHAHTFPR